MGLLDALADGQFRRDVKRNGLDLLQSASNNAASTVSAPVDALAWLLRKSGLNVPTPVGGSDWAQNQGYTKPVQEGWPKVAGDVLGNTAGLLGYAKAPEIAGGLLKMGENLAAPTVLNKQAGAVKYPQSSALELAQQRAALPVSENGLGLPTNNTAMDRAKALGYPMDMYGGSHEPIGFLNTMNKPSSPRKNAEKIKAELEQLGVPVTGETAGTGSTYLKFPGPAYEVSPAYGGGQSVPIEQMRFSTHSTRADGVQLNAPDSSYIADVFPKYGHSLDDVRNKLAELVANGDFRSRFAAFDPWRRNAAIAAAMGVAAPDLLAKGNK